MQRFGRLNIGKYMDIAVININLGEFEFSNNKTSLDFYTPANDSSDY